MRTTIRNVKGYGTRFHVKHTKDRIKARLEALRMEQEELARLTGANPRTLEGWLQGRTKKIPAAWLARAAPVLGVPLASLIGEDVEGDPAGDPTGEDLAPTFYEVREMLATPAGVTRGSKHAGLGTQIYMVIREGRKHGWGAQEYLAALETLRGPARELEDELYALHEELRRRDRPDNGERDP